MTTDDEFDIAIIGAGINGAGIARDAAMRGLRVVIIDKRDMCSGTSAVSSRLIHGGLRYLEYAEIPLVYESLQERRNLRRIAGHLVDPLRISIPIYDEARRGRWIVRLGMLAYDLLSWNKRLPRHDMLARDAAMQAEPGLRDDGLLAVARYYDAQVTYAERLVLENLLAARAAGAVIRTYTEVREISIRNGAVDTLRCVDRSGTETTTRVRAIINAAGPWVDAVLGTAPRPSKRFVGGTKGSHIIVDAFPGAPADACYVEAKADGRPFFIIPWNDQYLIGTTDIRYDGSLDTIRASTAEVDYLISETNRVFERATLTRDSVNYAYAGVRPLPFRDKGPESAITRRHIIKRNRKVAKGLVSIIGGKLTTYRNLAEQTVDRLQKVLRQRLPRCRTDDTPLPGASGIEKAQATLAASNWLQTAAAERMLRVYGGRAVLVHALAESDKSLRQALGEGNRYIAAEVVFAIRDELAVTLTDIIFRRIMAGLDSDQGRSIYAAVSRLAAAEFGWSAEETERQETQLVAYADSLRL